jgi:hypothetical protein
MSDLYKSETILRQTPVKEISVRRLRAIAPHEHRAVQITISPLPGSPAGTLLREAIYHADILTDEPPHEEDLVCLARRVVNYHDAMRAAGDDEQQRNEWATRLANALASDFRLTSIDDAIDVCEDIDEWKSQRDAAERWLNDVNAVVEER